MAPCWPSRTLTGILPESPGAVLSWPFPAWAVSGSPLPERCFRLPHLWYSCSDFYVLTWISESRMKGSGKSSGMPAPDEAVHWQGPGNPLPSGRDIPSYTWQGCFSASFLFPDRLSSYRKAWHYTQACSIQRFWTVGFPALYSDRFWIYMPCSMLSSCQNADKMFSLYTILSYFAGRTNVLFLFWTVFLQFISPPAEVGEFLLALC